MKTQQRLCDWCHSDPVDGKFREVVGIQERHKSKVIGTEDTGRLMCFTCARKVSAGAPIDQMELGI